MVHVRGMVGANAGADGGGGVRSGGVPRAGREDSWNMGLATLAGGVPGMLRFPSEGAEGGVGAEGADQALDVGQFGQPRLSAVDELHAREGGVALDFCVDNPLANSRDAGAAVAAGHRTLAKHDSSFRSREAAYDEYDGSPLRWCTGCRHWSNWYGVSLIVCVSQYPSC